MTKTKISNSDLAWIFKEKLREFDSCPPTVSIAIVPSKDGWTAVINARERARRPLCSDRIKQIERMLRGIYALAKD